MVSERRLKGVLISHPHGAAVSVGAAAALSRADRLALYVSGAVAANQGLSGWMLRKLAERRPVFVNRILRGIPAHRVRAMPSVELLARAVGRLCNVFGRRDVGYDALFALHDAAVAAMPWPQEIDSIYAYEDAALLSFRRAARRGKITRIWDLPLPHYRTLAQVWERENRRWPGAMGSVAHREPRWKRKRKDEELRLANVVSVASAYTRRSLEDFGVSKPILVAPYGFPVESFWPKTSIRDGPFTVLAVGTHDLRKGTPWLLEAWRAAALRNSRLRLIGPLALMPTFLNRYAGLFEHIPHVPKVHLVKEYQAADLVAFPTLGDGFGLVIQEAMACGTPVVTTNCGGGPECIEHGREGWIVETGNIDALVEQLRACAADRAATFAVGLAARRRAERWSWREAGDAFVTGLITALSRAS